MYDCTYIDSDKEHSRIFTQTKNTCTPVNDNIIKYKEHVWVRE
jgi:hypothetical protein